MRSYFNAYVAFFVNDTWFYILSNAVTFKHEVWLQYPNTLMSGCKAQKERENRNSLNTNEQF